MILFHRSLTLIHRQYIAHLKKNKGFNTLLWVVFTRFHHKQYIADMETSSISNKWRICAQKKKEY